MFAIDVEDVDVKTEDGVSRTFFSEADPDAGYAETSLQFLVYISIITTHHRRPFHP
jgi:hypothetical protein